MTQNKAQKSVIRQRMAETGEPYSVARRAVQAQPATAKDWDEEYYADGAASEGITVDEFKTREAADQESRGLPTVDAQAADMTGMPRPGWRHYRTASFGGVPPVPPMPPMPPVPPAAAPPGFPGASRFRGAARRASRPTQVPLTEDQARELGPFLEAADRAEQAAALARELAVRAQQQAERTQEHAEQAQERADLAEEWADEEEQEGSDEAQEQAEQAQERADIAEERAMQAQERAELAQERADEAREWADKAQEWPAV